MTRPADPPLVDRRTLDARGQLANEAILYDEVPAGIEPA